MLYRYIHNIHTAVIYKDRHTNDTVAYIDTYTHLIVSFRLLLGFRQQNFM